jgi:hypothetical protein
MPKGLWCRNGALAIPMDDRSREFLLSIKEGVLFVADTHTARNPKQLRLWWALADLVADQFDVSAESISDDLKVALGHTETIKSWNGAIKIKPKSIAFESMAQEHFSKLLTAAIHKVAEWLNSSPEDVQQRYNEMISEKRYEGMHR